MCAASYEHSSCIDQITAAQGTLLHLLPVVVLVLYSKYLVALWVEYCNHIACMPTVQ